MIDAEADFYSHHNAAVNRGTHMLGDESTSAFEEARETVANINGRPEEIVWTKNATERSTCCLRTPRRGHGWPRIARMKVGPATGSCDPCRTPREPVAVARTCQEDGS